MISSYFESITRGLRPSSMVTSVAPVYQIPVGLLCLLWEYENWTNCPYLSMAKLRLSSMPFSTYAQGSILVRSSYPSICIWYRIPPSLQASTNSLSISLPRTLVILAELMDLTSAESLTTLKTTCPLCSQVVDVKSTELPIFEREINLCFKEASIYSEGRWV